MGIWCRWCTGGPCSPRGAGTAVAACGADVGQVAVAVAAAAPSFTKGVAAPEAVPALLLACVVDAVLLAVPAACAAAAAAAFFSSARRCTLSGAGMFIVRVGCCCGCCTCCGDGGVTVRCGVIGVMGDMLPALPLLPCQSPCAPLPLFIINCGCWSGGCWGGCCCDGGGMPECKCVCITPLPPPARIIDGTGAEGVFCAMLAEAGVGRRPAMVVAAAAPDAVR